MPKRGSFVNTIWQMQFAIGAKQQSWLGTISVILRKNNNLFCNISYIFCLAYALYSYKK